MILSEENDHANGWPPTGEVELLKIVEEIEFNRIRCWISFDTPQYLF